jgi:MioC protein
MSTSLCILVGTTTGNAQYCAEEAAFRAQAIDVNAEVVPMDGLDASVFKAGSTYLLCVSTYGQGDVPDNARGVYETLVKTKPDLHGVRFGIVSLGDSSHAQTFCFAGRRFDTILVKLGAERVGDVLNHDASSGTMPEEATAEWMAGWLDQAFGAITPRP